MESVIERIRKHPVAIFGSNNNRGALCCIKNIVAMLLPYCDKVSIKLIDTNTVEIEAINVAPGSLLTWYNESRDTDNEEERLKNGSLYIPIKAVCENMEITVGRGANSAEYTKYIDGIIVEHTFRDADVYTANNITIKYKPSDKVFNDLNIRKSDLRFFKIQ